MDKHNHPFNEVAEAAGKLVNESGGTIQVFQKWTCEHCGARQTMDAPNTFFKTGKCEECGKLTDIEKGGCNYLLITNSSPVTVGEWKKNVVRSMMEAGASREEAERSADESINRLVQENG